MPQRVPSPPLGGEGQGEVALQTRRAPNAANAPRRDGAGNLLTLALSSRRRRGNPPMRRAQAKPSGTIRATSRGETRPC